MCVCRIPSSLQGNRPCVVSVNLQQVQTIDEVYFSVGLGDNDEPYYVSCSQRARASYDQVWLMSLSLAAAMAMGWRRQAPAWIGMAAPAHELQTVVDI